jgi:hypothetical protein
VEMGMMLYVLSPGMKHREKTDFGSQVFGVEQRLRRGTEQDSILHALVLQSQRSQQLRKREDHVEIRDRQQVRRAVGEPLLACRPLAFRAVPVETGVIRDDAMTAPIALLDTAAENRRSTVFDGVEDSEVDRVPQSAIGLYKLLSVLTDDIGHLVGRPPAHGLA